MSRGLRVGLGVEAAAGCVETRPLGRVVLTAASSFSPVSPITGPLD